MIFYDLISWWYGAGWLNAWQNVLAWPRRVGNMFSVPILLRTIFAPWRRIITPPGSSLDAKMRASVDNTVSRTVGFVVRSLVLFAALVITLLALVLGLAIAILWIFIPAGVLALIILGISG